MFNVDFMNLDPGNGFQSMAISSAAARDRLIKEFRKYIDKGYDPNVVISKVLRELDINEDDLLDEDVRILNKNIEDYYRRKHNGLY